MAFNILNIVLVIVMYQIYRRVPRTTGLTLDYFSGDLTDYENIPTY